jgi:hypothetical protein
MRIDGTLTRKNCAPKLQIFHGSASGSITWLLRDRGIACSSLFEFFFRPNFNGMLKKNPDSLNPNGKNQFMEY